MTAHYLVNSIRSFEQGDWCLVHAAAGGVGLLLVQLAKRTGLRVIATVSTPEKAERAQGAGADVVVNYTQEDFVEVAKKHSGGAGVRAVFDAVGKSTFDQSLTSLAPRGHMVLFGQASGPVDPVDPRTLQRGSLFLTRPALVDYSRSRNELLWRAQEVLTLVELGELKVHIHELFALRDAPLAHHGLHSRQTIGKLLLIP
jgi:NADPH2:quinone reductase